MRKSELVDLIESYHGDVNSESLIAQTPYQKGWVKKMFDTQTEGIAKLQDFLQSEPISKLSPDDEIMGDNLIALLDIIDKREQRIFKTYRSYEKYPEKSTNRVYQRLYQLLLLDASLQTDMCIEFDHTQKLNQVLTNRIIHHVLAELETDAHNAYDEEEDTQKANSGYLQLGIDNLFGRTINFTFAKPSTETIQGLSQVSKAIKLDNCRVKVEFSLLHNRLHAATFLDAAIQCPQNIKKGLEWLKLGSYNGDYNASIRLAYFYARKGDYRKINRHSDAEKTIHYLELAANQGSAHAARALVNPFGDIYLGADNNSYPLNTFR